MDGVLGYHLNPIRCGVAKFNLLLAERLNVPVYGLFDEAVLDLSEPLISVKLGEFTDEDAYSLDAWIDRFPRRLSYHLFLHGFTGSAVEAKLIQRAAAVYCGNAEVGAQLAPVRGDIVQLWAPGMIASGQRFAPTEISVFSFGMAHKVRAEKYLRLRELLDATEKSYSLYVSTALHENSTFDDEFGTAFRDLQTIFGEHAHFLGYLSDGAVYNRLLDSTYFAAFFDTGVRANNTSVNAALEFGCAVITNLDRYSPAYLRHGENVIDIEQAWNLPTDPGVLATMRASARATASRHCSWEQLAARLGTPATLALPPEALTRG